MGRRERTDHEGLERRADMSSGALGFGEGLSEELYLRVDGRGYRCRAGGTWRKDMRQRMQMDLDILDDPAPPTVCIRIWDMSGI